MFGIERDVYCLTCKEIVENPHKQKNYSTMSDNIALCDNCLEKEQDGRDK